LERRLSGGPIAAAREERPKAEVPAEERVAEPAPWPTEADEAAFRAGEQPAADPVAAVREERALPPLDELVARVPAEVRLALDNLFRAKFTAVRRVSPQQLKH